MFGKLVPVPSGAMIPDRDIGKKPILECVNLGITFGGLKAVEDFNLTIGRTEIAGLIGPTARARPPFLTCSPRSTSPPTAPSCWAARTPTA